jgi:hypothetical protein
MHASAKAFFGVGGPVFTVEADEDRGVGDGHCGFEDEDVELLAGFVDLGDDPFVRDGFNLVVTEKLGDLCAICGGSGGVIVWDEGEFGIHIDEGADMDRVIDGAEDVLKHIEMGSIGLDGFDTERGLQGVGGVYDEDPVAMAQEGDRFVDLRMPVAWDWGLGREKGRIEKRCEGEEEETNSAHLVYILCQSGRWINGNDLNTG